VGIAAGDGVVDLVPFILVTDVERSIGFYEALGFRVVKRYEPNGRLEFAGLEATSSAKVMLARVEEVPDTGPDAARRAFSISTPATSKLSASGYWARVIMPTKSRRARAPARTASCACATPTVTATWSPSCSRARSGATRPGEADRVTSGPGGLRLLSRRA